MTITRLPTDTRPTPDSVAPELPDSRLPPFRGSVEHRVSDDDLERLTRLRQQSHLPAIPELARMVPSTLRRWAAWSGLLAPSCACRPHDLRDDGRTLVCEGCRSPVVAGRQPRDSAVFRTVRITTDSGSDGCRSPARFIAEEQGTCVPFTSGTKAEDSSIRAVEWAPQRAPGSAS